MTTMLYEGEPRDIFDAQAWEAYRADMAIEVKLHPDRPEAQEALDYAVRHLSWLAERQAQRIAA